MAIRNWHAVNAHFRNAGAMRDRRMRRMCDKGRAAREELMLLLEAEEEEEESQDEDKDPPLPPLLTREKHMNTPINLETSKFQLDTVVSNSPNIPCWFKDNLTQLPDFGTVFVGFDDKLDDDTLEFSGSEFCNMRAPAEWRMPQLLRRLGAFKSAGDAKRNGWDMDIPDGCTEIFIRINRIRGTLWIHKNMQECG